MHNQRLTKKTIIGRKDKADFPLLKLFNIDVKIDTGAYTSSVHCHNIETVRQNGVLMVRFNLLDPSHADFNEKEYVLPVLRETRVKSSSGQSDKRIFIKTPILIFGRLFETEFSLTNRSDMKYPVLLGRKLLKQGFVVDVTQINLSYRKKKRAPKMPKGDI